MPVLSIGVEDADGTALSALLIHIEALVAVEDASAEDEPVANPTTPLLDPVFVAEAEAEAEADTCAPANTTSALPNLTSFVLLSTSLAHPVPLS